MVVGAQSLKGEHEENDAADGSPGGEIADFLEEEITDEDTCESGNHEGPDGPPGRVFAKEGIDEKVADDEERKDEAEGFFGAEEFGHEEDIDHGKAGESGLGEAHAEGAEESDGVFGGSDVRDERQSVLTISGW